MENTTLVADLTILQLTEQIQKRLAAIEWFTGHSYPDARNYLAEEARSAVELLAERGGGRGAETVAFAVCNLLFGELDPPAEFWATPLGADIAYAIGYPLDRIPQWAAAAVLGCSRISVFKAVQRGSLELTPVSLRAYLRNMPKWWRWSKTLQPDGATMQISRGRARREEAN